MRILMLGAGGTSGYFGGRLAQSGADVTFLVRPARAAALARDGLRIRSPLGDADLQVATVTADALPACVARAPFALVVLGCKAYDLASALDDVAPAMAGATLLPILNGLRHFPVLDARFGRDRVLGGLCFISATLGPGGEIRHLARAASLTFGVRAGGAPEPRVDLFAKACAQAGIEHVHGVRIEQAMWSKFTFLATLAAATCLMRAPIGDIVASDGGRAFLQALHAECIAVAHAAGEPVEGDARHAALESLTQPGSPLAASMLRDLEAGQRVEAAHIVGDMLQRSHAADLAAPNLAMAWRHLQAYEARRARA
ncbi:MAG TPA: 2-dehydropantoate 2-reductase [Luteimonas sp.]|nr:2-dehydropantoate 2-reductase [Luteimonas sp.]